MFTKILEVYLFAFAHRLFHEDFSPIDGTLRRFERNLHETVGVRSTVVERATHMRVYAGSSPTGAGHRKEFISALSFSPNDVK